MNDIRIETDPERSSEVRRAVVAGLQSYNEAAAGPLNALPLVLSARDDEGEVIGGLVAVSFWNALFIDLLWVSEAHRGDGVGKSLLARAELEAGARGCMLVYLNTFTFQAPGFYEKSGYSALGSLNDHPVGHARTWYSKRLVP